MQCITPDCQGCTALCLYFSFDPVALFYFFSTLQVFLLLHCSVIVALPRCKCQPPKPFGVWCWSSVSVSTNVTSRTVSCLSFHPTLGLYAVLILTPWPVTCLLLVVAALMIMGCLGPDILLNRYKTAYYRKRECCRASARYNSVVLRRMFSGVRPFNFLCCLSYIRVRRSLRVLDTHATHVHPT